LNWHSSEVKTQTFGTIFAVLSGSFCGADDWDADGRVVGFIGIDQTIDNEFVRGGSCECDASASVH
jgi:hypothetical protein